MQVEGGSKASEDFLCVLKFALYLGKATLSFLDSFYHVSLAALGNIFPIKQTNSC